MQSSDFLLIPLLKCFALALAQGILGNIVETNCNTVLAVPNKLNMSGIILNSKLTCLLQSGHPVWPLLWKEATDHPGFSESGILFPWDRGVCHLGTHKAENSDHCGTLQYSHCPSNVEWCLWKHIRGRDPFKSQIYQCDVFGMLVFLNLGCTWKFPKT